MIHYVDDFLPQEEFLALRKRVNSRFVATDKKKFETNSDEPVRLTYHDPTGNWREGCNYLGRECIPAVEKIITTMESLGIRELKNYSLWYQYIINSMTIPVHQDQALRNSSQENTYTAVIYINDWKPEWGGEFVVGDPILPEDSQGKLVRITELKPTHIVEPIPNRMLIWSRDVWHKVNKVTVDDPTYMRAFVGTGWSSISTSAVYRNAH
jgi:Rps23 Pro-64 3,4-dihydroxylase Tpa1-like proline 4-hydroxylase